VRPLWEPYFSFTKLERKRCLFPSTFDFMFKTDGHAVSVIMSKDLHANLAAFDITMKDFAASNVDKPVMQDDEDGEDEEEDLSNNAASPLAWRKHSFKPIPLNGIFATFKADRDADFEAQRKTAGRDKPKVLTKHDFDAESLKLLNQGFRIVAVDPGRTDIVYCAWLDKDGKVCFSHYSLVEYQNKCGFAEAAHKRWKWLTNRTDGLQSEMANLPPSKVSSPDDFLAYVSGSTAIFHKIFGYYSSDRMRKLRFQQYSRKQSAIADICNRIVHVEGDNRPVVVVFGAAKFNGKAPTQALRDALGRLPRVQLYHVNEYNTSKLCNGCKCRLVDHEDVWTVKYCTNKDCARKTHQRDKNAALNIKYVFEQELLTGERPIAFTGAASQRD
jgi:hypothetical protein